ncbi:MAG: hypothetical protein IH840_07555 [Candidatus Heimdallarchaeota archaeon]|nr:hypothetical protein [Candidatus Heimdallarchaeota archaeon]
MWKVQYIRVLILVILMVPTIHITTAAEDLIEYRNYVDQTDDFENEQFHIVYVIPQGQNDRMIDVNNAIARSVVSFQNWFSERTNFYLIFDTFDDDLDVLFYELDQTDDEMRNYGAWVVTEIERELTDAGLLVDDKIYALYYDGESDWACGGASWPPNVPGQSAAMYLKATPNRPNYMANCGENQLTFDVNVQLYWEFAMLHDLIHTLGFISTCSPNHAAAGHVNDDASDLMYTGTELWLPSKVDVNNDDYFNHNNIDCPDLADSAYLTDLRPNYMNYQYKELTHSASTTQSSTKETSSSQSEQAELGASTTPSQKSDNNPVIFSITMLATLPIIVRIKRNRL